jgi:chromosome segregation ATPase
MASLEQQIEDFASDLRSSLAQPSVGSHSPEALGHAIDTFVLDPIRREFSAVADHLDQNAKAMLQSLEEKAKTVRQEQGDFERRVEELLEKLSEDRARQHEIMKGIKQHLVSKNAEIKTEADFIPRVDKLVTDITEYRDTLKNIQRTYYKAYINSSERRGTDGVLIQLVNLTTYPYEKLELVLEGQDEAPITKTMMKRLEASATQYYPLMEIGKVTPGKRYTMTVYSNSQPLSNSADLPEEEPKEPNKPK